jgi:hypothetical protein
MMILSELSILAMLAGLAILPEPGPERWLVAGPLLLLACMPARATQGRLRRDRAAFVVALLIVTGTVAGPELPGERGLLLMVPVGLLALLGLVRFRKIPFGPHRLEMTLAVVCALVACALVTAGARGVLALRSSLPIEPGRVDFLGVMLFMAVAWFGLDTHLRWLPASGPGGGLDGLGDRLRPVLLAVAMLVAAA